ncbi:hypothetical protein Pint_14136 [Pistacia integerrima]|uniref:Uncharacterized protein n=1 Tax=Pistacia integerrima TaxID=434235 RepID=A0ACC0Y648_9ROSI|nr:hypothetical protein Pint_14136 [Pistacia integerrima]
MEAVELCLSNGTVENADNCSIVLELTENDPLFDKKKKLLLDKGFGVKVQIYLKSSSSLDSISNTLERMLQIARIIHLDEVELYFGEHDTQLGFYSTRNELEALNSMLLLVNNSLYGETYKQVNVLQDLQEAVIDKIHKIGNKYKVEMKIDKTYIGDKEKILVQWGENNGVRTKLEIACKFSRFRVGWSVGESKMLCFPNPLFVFKAFTWVFNILCFPCCICHAGVEGAGRGTIAMEDLKVGDIALEIPVSIIISEDIVYKCDLYNILQKIDGMSSETMLLLWSMKEKHNCDSKFKNYFDTLPKEFNTGLSFGVDAIMALEGTLLLEEIMQAKEHLRNQYDEFFPALCNDYPDIFPAEFYTWEQFLWACELWYSNSMKVMFADGKLRTCLIPIAGFLNHSNILSDCGKPELYPHIVHYGKVDSVTNSLKILMLVRMIVLRIVPCQTGAPTWCRALGAQTITIFSIMACLLHYWNYLRRVRNPLQQEKDLSQANLEIELEVLEDLQSTFSAMMENLGDSDFVDGENTSWDVKLAMESKDLQRKIISSILTSCFAGCKLVESELSRFVS